MDESLLSSLTSDYHRLQRQKCKKLGGIEGRILLNLGFVSREQYISYSNQKLFTEPRDPNKLYLMFDMIGPRLGKLIGRLASIAPVFKAQPDRRDPKAFAEAEVVDKLIRALDHKLVQPSRTWEILWWMAVAGTAFEYVPWIPNSSSEPVPQFDDQQNLLYRSKFDQRTIPEPLVAQAIQSGIPAEAFEVYEEVASVGDVGSEILSPLNVFVDQSVKSISQLSPDQWVHIARLRTLGYIEDNYGQPVEPDKEVRIVTTQFNQLEDSVGGGYLKDLIPLVQGSADDTDPPQAVVIESYAPPSRKHPHGRFVCWCPGKQVLHEGENPYEEVPLVDFHWKPVTTTFWTDDYVGALIPPQRFLNKRISQLGEQANATLYSTLLLGAGLTEEDIPADRPGAIKQAVADNGQPLIQRLGPPELPSWFMESIDTTVRIFNDIAGGSDLFEENRFPGQLRGPMAVPLLQEILDTEWGPLYEHIGERMAKVKQMRLNRVKQFYPEKRTLNYVDQDQKDEVFVFHTDKVLKGGLNFNVTVERGELVPELRALREARVMERLNGPLAILYMDERTGMLDRSKIAADLKMGDAGRESREAQYRKLGAEMVGMIWEGKQLPPVLPFYDHQIMLDELEAAMATTEFLEASPQIQQAFTMRWEGHRQYLMQEAQAAQQMLMSQQTHAAVAQATQQAAAQAASDTVQETRAQMTAQGQARGQASQAAGPIPRKRTLTVKEEG